MTIHQRNLQLLATEIFKLKSGLAPEIVTEVFEIQNPAYNFCSEATHFKKENVKKTNYGIQSVRYLEPKIWDMVPNNIKNCSSLNKFKNSIKSWKPNECPSALCKKYIAQVGFIWFTSPFCNISEKLYIFCIFWDCLYTFCICSLRRMRKFCLVSRWSDSPKGLRLYISWGFPHWGIGWNFCTFCSGCHYLLYLIVCLLSVYLFVN